MVETLNLENELYQKNSRKNKYFTEQIKLNERKYDLYMINANKA